MIDLKISIGAILGVLLTLFLTHRINKRWDLDKILKGEILSFKEVFIPHLQQLDDPKKDPGSLVTQFFPDEDKAARKLMLFLPQRKKNYFQEQWKIYTQYFEAEKQLEVVSLFANKVDDISKADVGTKEGIEYIIQQAEKRRVYAKSLINNILKIL
ncbi:MAG: hypothetical protein SD837_10010 [Candidatus Electrothrix scaldis]|nr:MAG: hypothetical protein SD837_10010 [Candidatus Electrothrix sp. GW3-3]